MNNIAIECKNVSKNYPLYKNDFHRLKGFLIPSHKAKEFQALHDVNLEVEKGKILGIIGVNGSGKSTLSNMIAKITYPSSGEVKINGEVNMLSANAGLANHLTGIENIHFKCTLLGFDDNQIKKVQESIIEYADIGVHIDQPLRTYSSGMRSRLGFAISIHMNPDILIIDEGLAVGDGSFYEKCTDKMKEIKESGKTIIYITHSVVGMDLFCDDIMWLHKGTIVGIDKPNRMIMPYCGFVREYATLSNSEREKFVPKIEYYQEKFL